MTTHHTDIACTRCGCVCDDLTITVEDGRVVGTTGACGLSEDWFLGQGGDQPPPSTIAGLPCAFDEAVGRAADILNVARSPLIYGLSRSSTEGQRAAAALADHLGATIDTTASRCHAPSIMAIQEVGESTCTLGEAKNRCDLVVFWGCDPVNSHPRHGERYSTEPVGMFLPNARQDRYVIVVDHQETDSAKLADWFIQVEKECDFELIWKLRCLLREGPKAGDESDGQMAALAERLRTCRSGIVYFGLGLAQSKLGHATVEALLRLVADLNDHTRFYARRMRIPGDVTGADIVLCWRTGFPFAVNLARGYPRYNPGEYSANEVLERQEADVCLLVGSEGVANLSEQAQANLQKIPTIVLDYPNVTCSFDTVVRFTTAVYGVHVPGTAYRMDETPIPLRTFLPAPYRSDGEVLNALLCSLGNKRAKSSL